ncbi:DUF300-domain-containing protein [Sistotremastrum suecicum HHB10207 ss-3]|uniref:DUF300-domain-containing protein n=1 Tax=Sistotremastrum suecicum HHB10207 ss-3 TaxID=1314776 RepID=A0A165Y8G0_9AGAM|nr:DUF300-domain-containing protein [Sistotremastrum suecicum HHB10207 ss-3]
MGSGAGSRLPSALLISCGISVMAASIISTVSIYLHLKNYRQPILQRMVIRILIMVPVYGISSLIAIFSLSAAFFIDAVRDIYEAFVIYCFFELLLAYLGNERSLLILLHGRAPRPPIFPVNLFMHEIDVSDPYTFLFLKRGILQYVQIKPILAAVTVLLKSLGKYNEGDLRAASGYLYVSIVYNFSIFLSLYCLAMFWACVHQDLAPFRPVPKFLTIKGIIFFSFWQSIVISILVSAGAITRIGPYTDSEHISLALTDCLICFEMPLFAIAHFYAFSHRDYMDRRTLYAARMRFLYAFRDAFGFRDVWEDSKATFGGEGMGYKEFEPAEGLIHQGSGRDRRIKAGLRYSKGGKKKYWLPMPAAETEPSTTSNVIQHAMRRDSSEEVYAPLLEDQADAVFQDGSDMVSDDEDELGGPSRATDGYSLYFGSPNASDDDLFGHSRRFIFGDYNYPTIDCSRESARKEMWEEEERILSNQRNAYFSPRNQSRGDFFSGIGGGGVGGGYGAVGNSIRDGREGREPSISPKGKERAREGPVLAEADVSGPTLVDMRDNTLPDVQVDGIRLNWTKHQKLQPSSRSSSHKQSLSPARRKPKISTSSSTRAGSGDDSHERVSSSLQSPSHSASSSTPQSAITSPRHRTTSLPSDAVDLIVEDPRAAERAMQIERKKGDPAVRSSGLRKVYKREYVAHGGVGGGPDDGRESDRTKKIQVEEKRSIRDGTRSPSELEGTPSPPDETTIRVEHVIGEAKEDSRDDVGEVEQEPLMEQVTEMTIAREESPPPHARVDVSRFPAEEGNPWA